MKSSATGRGAATTSSMRSPVGSACAASNAERVALSPSGRATAGASKVRNSSSSARASSPTPEKSSRPDDASSPTASDWTTKSSAPPPSGDEAALDRHSGSLLKLMLMSSIGRLPSSSRPAALVLSSIRPKLRLMFSEGRSSPPLLWPCAALFLSSILPKSMLMFSVGRSSPPLPMLALPEGAAPEVAFGPARSRLAVGFIGELP